MHGAAHQALAQSISTTTCMHAHDTAQASALGLVKQLNRGSQWLRMILTLAVKRQTSRGLRRHTMHG